MAVAARGKALAVGVVGALVLSAVSESGAAQDGETVILTTGVPVGRAGSTNLVKVHKLGEAYL